MASGRNAEQRGVTVGVVLSGIGLALAILLGGASQDGLPGGYALSVLGLMLFAAGAITVALYVPRVRRLNRLLAGQDLLARWAYRPGDIERQVPRDTTHKHKRNSAPLTILVGWLAFWGALLAGYVYLRNDRGLVPLLIAIVFGAGLLVGVVTYLAPGTQPRRAARSSWECLIGREGLFINGVYHCWVGRLNRLESVELVQARSFPRLVFHLSALGDSGYPRWRPYTVEAPVPADRLAEAQAVIAVLSERASPE